VFLLWQKSDRLGFMVVVMFAWHPRLIHLQQIWNNEPFLSFRDYRLQLASTRSAASICQLSCRRSCLLLGMGWMSEQQQERARVLLVPSCRLNLCAPANKTRTWALARLRLLTGRLIGAAALATSPCSLNSRLD
jgi:hypothetical protein